MLDLRDANPVIGAAGPRNIQLGMKVIFWRLASTPVVG
jgi:hypothetical protein